MASGHASRQWLEATKFVTYVVTPVTATVYLGTGVYPYLEKIIHNTSYIKYPTEQAKPPQSLEALEQSVREARRKRVEELKREY